jgi:photosystem II stability/assembly factor-like uncharacterized protein
VFKHQTNMKHLLLVMILGNLLANSVRGQNWTLTTAPTNQDWNSVACSADGARVIAVPWQGEIYISTNGGGNWELNFAPGTNASFDSVVSSADGAKLAALDGYLGVVYTSADAGGTWTSNLVSASGLISLLSSADGSKLVALGWLGAVYTSHDFGATWNPGTAPSQYATAIASSADGAKLLLVVAANYNSSEIYRSTNSGATWQLTGAPANVTWSSVCSSADGAKLAAGANGGIYTSADSGITWIAHTQGLDNYFITPIASSADGTKLTAVANFQIYPVGGGNSGYIFVSRDSGVSWVQAPLPDSEWHSIASSADGSRLFGTAFDYGSFFPPPEITPGAIYTSQTNFGPLLNLTNRGNKLVVSWTVPSTNFYLMQNANLDPDGWTYVYPQPTLNLTNLQLEVPITPTNNQCFYRLFSSSAQPGVQSVPGTPIIAVPISENLDQSQP